MYNSAQLWNFQLKHGAEESFTCMAADKDYLFAQVSSRDVYCLKLTTGELVWWEKLNFDVAMCLYHEQLIGQYPSGQIASFDKRNGNLLYEIPVPTAKHQFAALEPIVMDDNIICFSMTQVLSVHIASMTQKKLLFSFSLDRIDYPLEGDSHSFLTVQAVKNRLFFAREEIDDFAELFLVAYNTEQQSWNTVWTVKTIDDVSPGFAGWLGPLCHHGIVWIMYITVGETQIRGLNMDTGQEMHSFSFPCGDAEQIENFLDEQTAVLTDLCTLKCFHILDDILYYSYAVGDGETDDVVLHVGAIDPLEGKSLRNVACKETELTSIPARNNIAIHPNARAILGHTQNSVFLLWHQ